MAEQNKARVRIVSQSDSSRAAASRIYLDDKAITHLVKDVKVFIAGSAHRWNVELTMIAQVDIDITAETEFKPSPSSPTE